MIDRSRPAPAGIRARIVALLHAERFREALRALDDPAVAGELEPAEALALKAEARAGLAEFDEAERLAGQALALDPEQARAQTVLGSIAADVRGQPVAALGAFRAAIAADAGYAPAYYQAGLLLLRAGHEQAAAEYLRRAHELDPADWRFSAGVALLAPPGDRPGLLRAAYRAGMAEQPGSVRLRLRYLGTYLSGVLAPLAAGRGPSPSAAQQGVDAYRRLLARPLLVTYILLAINVAMFIFLETHGGSQNDATLERYGALDGALIAHQGQWWRLITPVFLHAGLTHLLVNSASLYFVGSLYERCVGPLRFLIVYLCAGLGGDMLSMALGLNGVGASGAIFGIFGGLGVYFFANRGLFGRIARSLLAQVLFFSVLNLLLPNVIPNVNGWAHLGGLLTGIVAAAVVGPVLPAAQSVSSPEALLAERRPPQVVAGAVAAMVAVLLVLAAVVAIWNPAGM